LSVENPVGPPVPEFCQATEERPKSLSSALNACATLCPSSTNSAAPVGRPVSADSENARPISVGVPALSSETYARALPSAIAALGPKNVPLLSGVLSGGVESEQLTDVSSAPATATTRRIVATRRDASSPRTPRVNGVCIVSLLGEVGEDRSATRVLPDKLPAHSLADGTCDAAQADA